MVRIVQQGGEFEINDAEAAVGGPVSDVPLGPVLMADAVLFKLGVEIGHFGPGEVLYPLSAVRGDQEELFGVGLEDAGDEGTFHLFEVAENEELVLEPLLGLVTPENLENPAVVADADLGPAGIFDLFHEETHHSTDSRQAQHKAFWAKGKKSEGDGMDPASIIVLAWVRRGCLYP
jgi:hypothetical protein